MLFDSAKFQHVAEGVVHSRMVAIQSLRKMDQPSNHEYGESHCLLFDETNHRNLDTLFFKCDKPLNNIRLLPGVRVDNVGQ